LGIALTESAFAGGLGMDIDLRKVPQYKVHRSDQLLFSESQSRFVVTVSREKSKKFEAVMKGNIFSRVGVVRKDERFLVTDLQGKVVIDVSIVELKESWQKTLKF
jgi:phosphoribosylformylglycinamidine synthase